MSDFVLLWSRAAAKSEWVEYELDMAVIRLLTERAIRIRLVRLDQTPIPLRLQPFHYISTVGITDPVPTIVEALREALSQPGQGTRHRFLNRNKELERIERLVNDPETQIIVLRGFLGCGKAALATESLRRFFEDPSVVDVVVSPGVGPVELALRLHHAAYHEIIPETETTESSDSIERSMREIAGRGQFMLLRNVQHWLDDEGQVEEPLNTIMHVAANLKETIRKPVLLTSTRHLQNIPQFTSNTVQVIVRGLPEEHVASLISLWHELIDGGSLPYVDAARLAPQIHGHPVAAKLAASLVSRYGVDHLLEYPEELVSLRRDLAKTLIRDIDVSGSLLALMETLAIIGTPVPSRVLAKVVDLPPDLFHSVIADATGTGLINIVGSGRLTTHPLVSDYFWRSHHDREGYMQRAEVAAAAVHQHLNELPVESIATIDVLRAVVRLYSLAGKYSQAQSVRSDLTGELAHVALTHYHRRQYDLAERFVEFVLDANPGHWGMRKCLARIHIRRQRWEDADAIITELLNQRPRDLSVRHLSGWRLMRSGNHKEALSIFTRVLAHKEDRVASLRDAAECLYRLERSNEALEFLHKAKEVETDNAYTLELEARIHEDAGDFEKALSAMRLAVVRNPGSWSLRHRLARIYHSIGDRQSAMKEVSEAVALDAAQFVSLSTLVSWLLDEGDGERTMQELPKLRQLATNTRERQLYDHLHARQKHLAGDYEAALLIVDRQVHRGINLAASLGLMARIRLDQIDHVSQESPASARILLNQAENAMHSCQRQPDHDPVSVQKLRRRIDAVKTVLSTLEG